MRKLILSVAAFLALAAPAAGQVREFDLFDLYVHGREGAGVSTESGLVGPFVHSITMVGSDSIRVRFQPENAVWDGNAFAYGLDSLTFAVGGGGGGGGVTDGVLTGGSFNASTQMLTLTLSQGGPVNVDLGGLLTVAEVETFAQIGTSATIPDGRIPSAVTRDSEVEPFALTSTSNQVPDARIPASIARDSELPAPDGVVTGGTFSGTTLTLMRSVGGDVQIVGIGGGGGTIRADGRVSGGRVVGDSLILGITEGHDSVGIGGLPQLTFTTQQRAIFTEYPGLSEKIEDVEILGEGRTWVDAPSTTAAIAGFTVPRPTAQMIGASTFGASAALSASLTSGAVCIRIADTSTPRNFRIVVTNDGNNTSVYYSASNFREVSTTFTEEHWCGPIAWNGASTATVQRSAVTHTSRYRGEVEARRVTGQVEQGQISSDSAAAGDALLATGDGNAQWGTIPAEIPMGGALPDTFAGPVFFLTHDQQRGTREDIQITLEGRAGALSVQWRRNRRGHSGTIVSGDPGPLSNVLAVGDADGTFQVQELGSQSQDQLANPTHVILDGEAIELDQGVGYSGLNGEWQTRIVGGPSDQTNPLSVNFLNADSTYWYTDRSIIHTAGLYEWDPNALGGGEYIHTGVGSAEHGDINVLSIYANWAQGGGLIDTNLRTVGNIYQNGGRPTRILAASAPFMAGASENYDIRYFPLNRVDDDSYLTSGDGTIIASRPNVPINQQEFLVGRLDDPILVAPGQYFMVGIHHDGSDASITRRVYGGNGTNETNTPIQNFQYVGPARSNLNSIPFEGPQQVFPTGTAPASSIRMQIEFEVPGLPGFTDIDVNGSHLLSVPTGIEFNGSGVTGSVSADGNTAILTFADAVRGNSHYYAISRDSVSGTGDSIAVRTGAGLTAIPHGTLLFFESLSANTGGVRMTVDGVTHTVQRSNGNGAATALTGGEITAGDPVLLLYEARFGLWHWIPGHMGLLATENAVDTDLIEDGSVTDAKLGSALRGEIHGAASPQATYQVQGTVTSAFANSQTNWIGNIFVANVDMIVYGGRAFVNRPSNGGNSNYSAHVIPINRNSDTDFRIGNLDDVFHTPPDLVRNATTDGDFADEISVSAGSGLTELEFHTGELSGLSVEEGSHFAVLLTSHSQGRSYVVSNLDPTPSEEPHVGDGDFPFAGFRWAAPFRHGSNTIGAGTNYYGSDPTRVVRMQVDYAVASASTFAGFDEGSEVYTGASVVNCVGAGVTCSDDTTNGRFEINVPGATGGTADGVVDDATLSYDLASTSIRLALDRSIGATLNTSVALPAANLVRVGVTRFADANETVAGTDDDIAVSPDGLAAFAAQQTAAGGYDLTYGVNEDATGVDNQVTRLIGNIYRAGTDATIYRWRMQADVVTNTSRVYTARAFVVDSISAANYQRGTNTLHSPPSRSDPGDAYTATSEVTGAEAEVEAFIQDGFDVSAGDLFFLGLSHGGNSVTYLLSDSGADEDTHTGHEDFPHGTIAYRAKGSASQEAPDATHDVFHNTTNAMRMSVDYEVADVLTGYEEGAPVYIGASALNCVGTGITCSEDTAGRLQLVVPGGSGGLDIGALTNLPSNQISDTDQFVLNDVSVPENRRATVGEIAARLADGTTITSGSGTLSAAFGNVPNDLLPDTDNSGEVGNAGRTWADGQFTDLTVNSTLTAGGTVTTAGSITATGDIRTSSDVILNDDGQILLGTGRDVSIDYDGDNDELEIRLGADADQIRIFDGNGNDAPYTFTKAGLATFENLTVTGTLTAPGIGGGGGGAAFSGALVDRSADIALNGALAAVAWNTEEFDEGGWHSIANSTRLTVPASVDYVRVSCSIRFENVANGSQALAQIRQNGSHLIGLPQQTGLTASPSSSVDVAVTSAVVEVDAGDYFECFKQSNDNAITVATESWFGIVSVTGGGGGGGTDLTNISGDVLPSADNIGNVGTGARTWRGGRFDSLTVDSQFDVAGHTILAGGIEINGDITAINDIHLGDDDQLVFGDSQDATFDYNGSANDIELRLGEAADAFMIFDGNGNDDSHTFRKDGSTILGGNVTARGNLLPNADGSHSVGTAARTWASGHFTDLTVDDEFHAQIRVQDAEAGTFTQAGADCEFELAYDNVTHNLEVCTNVPHVQGASGTWLNIPTRTDFSVEESRAFIASPSINDYVFDAGAQHFYIYTAVFSGGTLQNRWVQTTATAALSASRSNNTYGVRFLGEQVTDQAATDLIGGALAADTDYFYVLGDDVRRLALTSYTAPTTVDHWEWKPVHQGLVVVKLSQAEYDAITTKDDNILYVIDGT